MISTGAFAALLIIGLILAIIGASLGTLAPLGQDVSGYYGIAGFGIFLIVAAIIYLMVMQAKHVPAK